MNGSVVHVFPKDEIISLSTISVFIIILAVPANILVLFGHVTSRSTRVRPSSVLLVSLTFAQLLISVVVIPSQILQIIKPDLVANRRALCTFVGTTFYSLYITVTETLACMSVDRFLAVKSMLRYSSIITRKRVVAVVVFTWIHAVIFETIIGPFAVQIEYNYRLGACGMVLHDRIVVLTLLAVVYSLTPFGIIIVFNYKMAVHLRRHNRRILHRAPIQSIDERRNTARLAQERKVAFMVLWINTTCLLCWMPLAIVRAMEVTSAYPSQFLNAIVCIILHISTIVNAVLNLYFCGDVRKAITRSCLRRGDLSEDTITEMSFKQ